MNKTTVNKILVIGTASLDRLHLPQGTVATAGGAGMYTALAAQRAGAACSLFAPYPAPMPETLQKIDARIRWIGPTVPPEALPRLEIAHHGDGTATLLDASWGSEVELVTTLLADDLSDYHTVHIAALSSAQRQLDFLHACRKRGACRISVGTYAKVVYGEGSTVKCLFEEADIFFMNENEANGLLGSPETWSTQPGKLLFITVGAAGAWVLDGTKRIHVPSPSATEVDPTGAGDTFCGMTLAVLAQGAMPASAAEQATQAAAYMIEFVGPSGLL